MCLSCLQSHNLPNGYNNRWKKTAVLCFNLWVCISTLCFWATAVMYYVSLYSNESFTNCFYFMPDGQWTELSTLVMLFLFCFDLGVIFRSGNKEKDHRGEDQLQKEDGRAVATTERQQIPHPDERTPSAGEQVQSEFPEVWSITFSNATQMHVSTLRPKPLSKWKKIPCCPGGALAQPNLGAFYSYRDSPNPPQYLIPPARLCPSHQPRPETDKAQEGSWRHQLQAP